jgi:serine protease Do
VILNNGLEIPGEVVRKVDTRDVALVRVRLRAPSALPLRQEGAKKLEKIYVVGTPIAEKLSSTITSGVISGNRADGNWNFIQADAPISPGNCGGPLLDEFGNVLGVSVKKIVAQHSEGLSLFIPISSAFEALRIKVVQPDS